MQEIGDLKCPVEAVERASEIEILESLLPEQSIAEDPQRDGSVPPLLVGFVDLQFLLKLYAVLDGRSLSE